VIAASRSFRRSLRERVSGVSPAAITVGDVRAKTADIEE
jgi:hypothetical protein